MELSTVSSYLDDEPLLDEEDYIAPEDKCPGCPNHKDGPHKFSCQYAGAQQIALPAILEDGIFHITLPGAKVMKKYMYDGPIEYIPEARRPQGTWRTDRWNIVMLTDNQAEDIRRNPDRRIKELTYISDVGDGGLGGSL